MLRRPECLAADDVTIRCHVRHSDQASQKEFTESQDMICTMRVWHKTKTPESATVVRKIGISKSRSFEMGVQKKKRDEHGPELVLTSNEHHVIVRSNFSGELVEPIQMSKRFTSFGNGSIDRNRRSGSRQRQRLPTPMTTTSRNPNALSEVTVPISDIMVVDMHGQGKSHQCSITTMSNGFFELTMENRNGQDVLLAFLKAILPKDRVMEGLSHRTTSELSERSGGTKSFDVEALTAKRMTERIESETLSEKLRRKVVRVFSSFEDLSVAFSECACGCSNEGISPAPHSQSERRDSPPPNQQYGYDDLEHAPDRTPERRQDTGWYYSEETKKRQDLMKECNLPSGLSVEYSDGPELEKTAL